MLRLLAWLTFTLPFLAQAATPPRFWGELNPGVYAVGLRTEEVRADATGPRLVISVWYPAATGGTPMSFGDYLRLSPDLFGAEPGFIGDAAKTRLTLAAAITGDPHGISDAMADEILASPMAAAKDAKNVPKKFPLLLWAPRYATTVSQSVMSEFFASRGYVVAFARRADNPEPLPFQAKSDGEKRQALKNMVSDMARAYARLKNASNVDPDAVAALAYSYSGEAAVAFQQSQPKVKMVVGFSTPLLSDWVYRPQAEAAVVAANIAALNIKVPYALIAEQADRAGKPKTKSALLDRVAADTYFIRLKDQAHGSFNALEGMVPAMMKIDKVQPWSKAGDDARKGYEAASRSALRLLDHYFFAILTQAGPLDGPFAVAGVDSDMLEIEQKRNPARLPASKQDFKTVEFQATDGLLVTADLYSAGSKTKPTIIALHQSGASRGEYRQTAPRLVALGFNILAIDVRWGERDRWNQVVNETAARFGTPAIAKNGTREQRVAIRAGIPHDIEGAMQWLAAHGIKGPTLLWGSSISANAVLEFAASHNEIAAVLSFSPGEYNDQYPTQMQTIVKALRQPAFIACGTDEKETSEPIFSAIPGSNKTFYWAPRGRHGSSILIEDPHNMDAVAKFLRERHPPTSDH